MLSLDYIRNQAQELQAAGIENAKNEIAEVRPKKEE